MDRPLANAAALVTALLAAPAMAAEDPPPFVLVGEVEAGWTSNVTGSALALADRYLVHRQTLEFGGAGEGVELRGTLGVEETRFYTHDFADARAAHIAVEAGARTTEGLVIRGALSLHGAETGDDLMIGDPETGFLFLPTRTSRIEAAARLEAGWETAARAVLVGGELRLTRVAETEFPGTGIPPLRLDPDTGLAGLGARWREQVSPQLAAVATVAFERSVIAEADRLAFGLPEVGHLSARFGIEATPAPGLAVGAEGAAHTLRSEQLPGVAVMLPALRATAALALGEGVGLTLERAQTVSLAEPIDGFASFLDRTAARVSLALTPELSLGAEGYSARERGVLAPDIETRTRGAALDAELAAGEAARVRLSVGYAETDDGVLPYDARTVALGITGRLMP